MRNWRENGGKSKGKNGIPEGWQGCPPMSTGFIDDRFFVFKTPFKPELNGKLPQAERFQIDNIFERLHHMNARIGLWIDLTNTARYYDPKEVVTRGVMYEKFACEGHGTAPSKRAIFDFCGLVHRFFKSNRRDYIGVHCTHGFNRTGFLICSYLIRFRRYTAEEAVMEFAKYRQPGIYRQSYVDTLYQMSQPIQRPLQVTEPIWLQQRNQGQPASSTSTSQSQSITVIPPGIVDISVCSNPSSIPVAGVVTNMSSSSLEAHFTGLPSTSSSGGSNLQVQIGNNNQIVQTKGSILDTQLIQGVSS